MYEWFEAFAYKTDFSCSRKTVRKLIDQLFFDRKDNVSSQFFSMLYVYHWNVICAKAFMKVELEGGDPQELAI